MQGMDTQTENGQITDPTEKSRASTKEGSGYQLGKNKPMLSAKYPRWTCICAGSQVQHHFPVVPQLSPAGSGLSSLWSFFTAASTSPSLLLYIVQTVSEFSPRSFLSRNGFYTAPHNVVHRGGYPSERNRVWGSC